MVAQLMRNQCKIESSIIWHDLVYFTYLSEHYQELLEQIALDLEQ